MKKATATSEIIGVAEPVGRQIPAIQIRRIELEPEFEQLVDIQREVWKHDEADLTPVHQFRIHAKLGGIILGAFIGNRLAGFVYSFPAVLEKKSCQHSHHLAVRPEYQGLGIGKKLKWAQRDNALEMGYDLITWTVDPLQAKNANLNIHALGAVTRTYLPNFYGMESGLVLGPNIPTDRFMMEWRIKEKSVEIRRRGKFVEYNLAALPRSLERKSKTDRGLEKAPGRGVNHAPYVKFVLPGPPRLNLTERRLLAEVPPAINSLKGKPDVIAAWQRALRSVLRHYFRQGYEADDFLFGGRCFYVLRRGQRRYEGASG
jgi:predicted GNAT superfamily acetyltransferase